MIPSITSPTNDEIYYHGQWSVNLIGTAINPQGDYTCSWSSSVEGSLGSGCNINTNFSTEGTHIITLSVTDDYQTKETSILITITDAPAPSNPFGP